MGLGQTPDFHNGRGGVVLRVVGQKQKDVQLCSCNAVLPADRFHAGGIESFCGEIMFPGIQGQHNGLQIVLFRTIISRKIKPVNGSRKNPVGAEPLRLLFR